MKKKTLNKIRVVALATTVALASSIGTATYLNELHEEEVTGLSRKLDSAHSYSKQKDNDIMELQSAMIKKSEQLVDIQSSHANLIDEHNVLKENYETTKESYQKNLKALNLAEEKIEKQKTKAISEKVTAPKNNSDYTSWKKMIVESTAYTKYENGDKLASRKWGNITKSGQPVRYGVIAVDTNVIPLGTEVYIPALNGVFVALDTGSAIKGNIIDVYFNTLEECIQWGRKHGLEVYVNM